MSDAVIHLMKLSINEAVDPVTDEIHDRPVDLRECEVRMVDDLVIQVPLLSSFNGLRSTSRIRFWPARLRASICARV